MDDAQVAIAGYCPAWWPTDTRLLIRRVRLDAEQVSADLRSRRHRILHPDQRALPLPELAAADAIYAYSFIMTNLDVTSPAKAVAAAHWYRHRTTIGPTRAGVVRWPATDSRRRSGRPRASGDGPCAPARSGQRWPSAPRERGWSAMSLTYTQITEVGPARAGMVRCCRRTAPSCCRPRTSVGGPINGVAPTRHR